MFLPPVPLKVAGPEAPPHDDDAADGRDAAFAAGLVADGDGGPAEKSQIIKMGGIENECEAYASPFLEFVRQLCPNRTWSCPLGLRLAGEGTGVLLPCSATGILAETPSTW